LGLQEPRTSLVSQSHRQTAVRSTHVLEGPDVNTVIVGGIGL
jgi:hypothetical protein